MQERKDKFISNVYKSRIDQKVLLKNLDKGENNPNELYWCETCKKLYTKEQALRISCVASPEKTNLSQASTARSDLNPLTDEPADDIDFESQDTYVGVHGNAYIHHDITFAEEVHHIAKDQINDQDSPKVIKASQPINSEAFVKFFREKYRLCWKEIYLKFMAMVCQSEHCTRCRRWFQVSEIGGCWQ